MVCFPVHAVIKAYKLIAYPTTCELLRALGLPKPSPPVTGNGIHHVFPPSREGGDVDRIAGSDGETNGSDRQRGRIRPSIRPDTEEGLRGGSASQDVSLIYDPEYIDRV